MVSADKLPRIYVTNKSLPEAGNSKLLHIILVKVKLIR